MGLFELLTTFTWTINKMTNITELTNNLTNLTTGLTSLAQVLNVPLPFDLSMLRTEVLTEIARIINEKEDRRKLELETIVKERDKIIRLLYERVDEHKEVIDKAIIDLLPYSNHDNLC
jgi:hypothetical protein